MTQENELRATFIKEATGRASKNCEINHRDFFRDDCSFCQFDKAVIEALEKSIQEPEKGTK